jgi:hypothetical protein
MIFIPKYKNVVELEGSVSLVLTDTLTNTISQELYVPNLVVTEGKGFIASRMIASTANVMSHMGIGTSGAAEGAAQTTLTSELTSGVNAYARQNFTSATNPTANQVQYTCTFPAGIPNAPTAPVGVALQEAGIFNQSTGGTMLCRTVFPIVTKLPADALTITWTITVS